MASNAPSMDLTCCREALTELEEGPGETSAVLGCGAHLHGTRRTASLERVLGRLSLCLHVGAFPSVSNRFSI